MSNNQNTGLSRASQDFNPNDQQKKSGMPMFFNSKKGPGPETTPVDDAPLTRNFTQSQQPPQTVQV